MTAGCASTIALVAALATSVEAQSVLSGTVRYTGTQGPVSVSRPILVILHGDPFFEDDRVDSTTVTTNGGSFVLQTPAAGNYYLACVLEAGSGSDSQVGDPFEIYNDQFNFPAAAVAVPGTVNVEFDDSWRLPGIGGTVTYTGAHGVVSENTPLLVEAFTDANLTNSWDEVGVASSGGRYSIISFADTPLYLRASLDLNGNHQFDPGEPYEIYNNRSAAPADPVMPGATQTAINFSFADESTCVGDCDRSGDVTVNELITMVNIALGGALLSACPAGDADSSGEITVDEIVKAVGFALTSCPGT